MSGTGKYGFGGIIDNFLRLMGREGEVRERDVESETEILVEKNV